MGKGKTSVGNNGLFPSTWVVGEAAAELSKNGDGVLLAESGRSAKHPDGPAVDITPTPAAFDQDQQSDDPWPHPVIDEDVLVAAADTATVAVPEMVVDEDPAVAVARRREQEIAALHAENERLRRRITLTRRTHDSGNAAAGLRQSEAQGLPFILPGDPAAEPEVRRKRAVGSRTLILVVIVLVGAGLFAAWSLRDRSDLGNGTTQQPIESLSEGMRSAYSALDMPAIARDIGDAVAAAVGTVSAWMAGPGEPVDAAAGDPQTDQPGDQPVPPAAAPGAR